jgi:hypothetical protein
MICNNIFNEGPNHDQDMQQSSEMTLEQIVEIPIIENEIKKKRGRKANTK